jgi:hypothetical protein
VNVNKYITNECNKIEGITGCVLSTAVMDCLGICTGGRQGFRTAGQEDDLFLLASHRHPPPLSLYREGPTNGPPRPTRLLTAL